MKFPYLLTVPAISLLLFSSCRRPAPEQEDRSEQKAAVEQLAMERWQLARERAALQDELDEFDRRLQAGKEDASHRASRLEKEKEELAEQEKALEEREKALAKLELELEDPPPPIFEEQAEPVLVAEPVHDFIQDPDSAWQGDDLPAVADYGTFYEDLSPHGDWFETSDYGYIWRPTVVVQVNNWRPYCDGRWVWTDCGWSWVSNEPFGWATYHYGRWTILPGHGWVWVPGHRWAPAWVCWRQGGSHIGWAPLPPECADGTRPLWGSTVEREFGIGADWFCFVKTQHFAGELRTHCLARRENRALLAGTTNVTLIHERRGRIIVGGPDHGDLCRRLGRRMPRLTIDLDRVGGDRRSGVVSGDRLLVTAPTVDADWNAMLRPRRLAGKIERIDDPRHSKTQVLAALEQIRSRRTEDRGRAEEQFKGKTPEGFDQQRREQLARQRALVMAQLRDRDEGGRPTVATSHRGGDPGTSAEHGGVPGGGRDAGAGQAGRRIPAMPTGAFETPRGEGAGGGLASGVTRPVAEEPTLRTQERPAGRGESTGRGGGQSVPSALAPGQVEQEIAEEQGQAIVRPDDRRTGGRTSAGRGQQAAMLRQRVEQARRTELAAQQEQEQARVRQQEEARQAEVAEQQQAMNQQRDEARQARLAEEQRQQEQTRRAELAEQQQAMRQQQEEARRAQLAEQQRQQEQTRRAELAEQQRVQQQAMRQQQEEARRAQLAEQQRQQEQTRRAELAEQQRAQEQARQAQEAAQRRQQEEARRQAQEDAMRRQAEQARQAQEAAQRQAQEAARRQAEDAARRQQEEAQRQNQGRGGQTDRTRGRRGR